MIDPLLRKHKAYPQIQNTEWPKKNIYTLT